MCVAGSNRKLKDKMEQQTDLPSYFPPDNQTTIPSRSVSQLSYSSGGSGSAWGPRCSSYLTGPDDSEGDDDQSRPCLLYQSHLGPLSHTSQESLHSSNPPPQVCNIIHIHIFQPSFKILIISSLDDFQRIDITDTKSRFQY